MIKLFSTSLIILLLGSSTPLLAQDSDSIQEMEPAVEMMDSEALAPAAAKPDLKEGLAYISLRGGGELIGEVVKVTPDAVFMDVGPEILRLEKSQIAKQSSLADAREEARQRLIEEMDSSDASQLGRLLPAVSNQNASQDLLSQNEVLDRAKESVVLISNPRGAGSGFIYDTQGRIVTNHHVINREKLHNVTLFRRNDKDQWEKIEFKDVEVESFSWLYDVALLKLDLDEVEEEGVELKPLPLAASRSLSVGDPVFAIGNPGGLGRMLEHTVSEGIVSSLTRNVNDVLYIQTTAAVNPGNSGGPLVNAKGEVVGIITLKSMFQEGIGFALPVSLVDHFLANSEAYAFGDQAENDGIRYLTPPRKGETQTEISESSE